MKFTAKAKMMCFQLRITLRVKINERPFFKKREGVRPDGCAILVLRRLDPLKLMGTAHLGP